MLFETMLLFVLFIKDEYIYLKKNMDELQNLDPLVKIPCSFVRNYLVKFLMCQFIYSRYSLSSAMEQFIKWELAASKVHKGMLKASVSKVLHQ